MLSRVVCIISRFHINILYNATMDRNCIEGTAKILAAHTIDY